MKSVLTLQRRQLDLLSAHLARCWPNEICGYLAGVGCNVASILEIPNVSANPRTSFLMDPQSQLNALISVENSKHSILAVYHSHPVGSNSYPSELDTLSHEDPNCLFAVILPNERRLIDSFRVFRLLEGRYTEIPISIEPALRISAQWQRVG